MSLFQVFWLLLHRFSMDRRELVLENLALRQQLAVLKRKGPRPKFRPVDRWFWVWLSRHWSGWKSALHIVSPATVVRWHREGFQRYWRARSPGKPGRPAIPGAIRELIRRMSRENTRWGAPRIQAELRILGHDVAQSTVAKYLARGPKAPSPTWRSFLNNHIESLAAVDFFVVP